MSAKEGTPKAAAAKPTREAPKPKAAKPAKAGEATEVDDQVAMIDAMILQSITNSEVFYNNPYAYLNAIRMSYEISPEDGYYKDSLLYQRALIVIEKFIKNKSQ